MPFLIIDIQQFTICFLEKGANPAFLSKKNVFLPPQTAETPRSSSWPRTSGFHPEDQGFESPTRYKGKCQLFIK